MYVHVASFRKNGLGAGKCSRAKQPGEIRLMYMYMYIPGYEILLLVMNVCVHVQCISVICVGGRPFFL